MKDFVYGISKSGLAVIKLLKKQDKNFNKDQVYKNESGSFKIFIPEWLKI